jgi:hypothetical protein
MRNSSVIFPPVALNRKEEGQGRTLTYTKDVHQAPKLSKPLSACLVLLLFGHFWLANSTLKPFQRATEIWIALSLIGILGSCGKKLSTLEVMVTIVYCLSFAISSLYNEWVITLLNAKVYGLGILSLFVFSRVRIDDSATYIIIGANILITLYQYVVGDPAWYVELVEEVGGSWKHLLGSRPLGLFMTTHGSAFLTAAFLLRFGRNTAITSFTGVLLFLTRSNFTIASYVCQFIYNVLRVFKMARYVMPIACVLVLGAFSRVDRILMVDLSHEVGTVFSERDQLSYSAIAEQLLSAEAYRLAFTWLPKDSSQITSEEGFINWAGNEVAYFTMVQQGGIVLCVLYLWLFFRNVPVVAVFFAVSLLHYGTATLPVAVLLSIQASHHFHDRISMGAGNQTKTHP